MYVLSFMYGNLVKHVFLRIHFDATLNILFYSQSSHLRIFRETMETADPLKLA